MSFMDKVKSGLDKAQDEINEFAETTKIKMEISKLQSRKTELFGEIGQQVYALPASSRAPAEVDAACKEVDGLEDQIKAKNEQIAKLSAPAGPETPKTA